MPPEDKNKANQLAPKEGLLPSDKTAGSAGDEAAKARAALAVDSQTPSRQGDAVRLLKAGDPVMVEGSGYSVVRLAPNNLIALLQNSEMQDVTAPYAVSDPAMISRHKIQIGNEQLSYHQNGTVLRQKSDGTYERLCEYLVKPTDEISRPTPNPISYISRSEIDSNHQEGYGSSHYFGGKDGPYRQTYRDDGTHIVHSGISDNRIPDSQLPSYQGDSVNDMKVTRIAGRAYLIDTKGNVVKPTEHGLKLVPSMKVMSPGKNFEPVDKFIDATGSLKLPQDLVTEYKDGSRKLLTDNTLIRHSPGLEGATKSYTLKPDARTTPVTIDGKSYLAVEETGDVLERQPDGSVRQRVEFDCPRMRAGSEGAVGDSIAELRPGRGAAPTTEQFETASVTTRADGTQQIEIPRLDGVAITSGDKVHEQLKEELSKRLKQVEESGVAENREAIKRVLDIVDGKHGPELQKEAMTGILERLRKGGGSLGAMVGLGVLTNATLGWLQDKESMEQPLQRVNRLENQ